MTLLEAQACGLPMVSVDCATGPGDIISDQQDGLVVDTDDKQGLVNALSTVMLDQNLRQHMSDRARVLSHRFSPEEVFPLWKQLIEG